jgi:hypothetical protein
MGNRAGLDDVEKREICCPCRESNPNYPTVQPVPSHCVNVNNISALTYTQEGSCIYVIGFICLVCARGMNHELFLFVFLACSHIAVFLFHTVAMVTSKLYDTDD